jgi:outer membrane protein
VNFGIIANVAVQKLLSYNTKKVVFMKKKSFTSLIVLIVSLLAARVHAQEVWSLQRCIGYALEQSLTIKQSQANVKTAQLSESQARASRLPNLSFSANVGEQLGATVDPTTSQFAFTNITTNSLNLNAGVPVYSGGRINQSIKQAQLDEKAASADLAQATNTLALQVATAYLNILLNKEQLENTQNQVALSKRQLSNTMKLIDAGNLPLADRYNVEAQIAREEQAVITAENNLELSYLNLKQLMQLEPDFDLQVEQPEINPEDVENLTAMKLSTVFETAKTTQPSLQAAEYRLRSSERGVEIAKAGYLPTVSLFGNMSAFYSSSNKTFIVDPNAPFIEGTPSPVVVGGFPTTLSFLQPDGAFKNVSYFDQLDRTQGQSFGLQLNVPIYQNGNVRLAVERAKLGVLSAQLQQNQVQQQLKNDIQTALASARNAKKQLEASQKTYDAAQLAYTNMEKRHAIGAVNALELNTAKNSMDVAANNRTQARYDYLFRLKILEFYLGKPLLIDQK